MSYRSVVRHARLLPLVLGLLGGCVTDDSEPVYTNPGGYGGGGGGYGGGGDGGNGGYGDNPYCSADSDCNPDGGSAYVCARDEECLMPSQIWTVHVTWTVSGQPASATSCTNAPDLQLFFGETGEGGGYDWGFAPVPCAEGEFTIDKMPTYFQTVDLLRDTDDTGGATGTFDGSGDLALDLPY
jgi:hypothetical protein